MKGGWEMKKVVVNIALYLIEFFLLVIGVVLFSYNLGMACKLKDANEPWLWVLIRSVIAFMGCSIVAILFDDLREEIKHD